MVTEFAEIDVKPGTELDFIAGVNACVGIFARAQGCHGVTLQRSIEAPQHFALIVEWDDVAAHNAFRASDDFNIWRGAVGGFFATAPHVWHGEQVVG
jgi:heme-degrading monooxygenase HmoA